MDGIHSRTLPLEASSIYVEWDHRLVCLGLFRVDLGWVPNVHNIICNVFLCLSHYLVHGLVPMLGYEL